TILNCLAPLSLNGDKLLPFVRNRFRKAYELAKIDIPSGIYVRVWNLVYLCNKKLKMAVSSYERIREPLHCPSEATWPPIVWFAWGPPSNRFHEFKTRFLQHQVEHPFYYDMDAKQVVAAVPGHTSRVKHTQGLSAELIEVHLETIVGGLILLL